MSKSGAAGRRGFTLVEIIVVVITIGILAAITLPNMVGASEEARASAIAESFRSIENAASQYQARHGEWPASAVNGAAMETNFAGELKGGKLTGDPPTGGDWRWVNSGAWQYPYIYTNSASESFTRVATRLDEVMDDGVSNKGRVLHFRFGTTGYIFYLPRPI